MTPAAARAAGFGAEPRLPEASTLTGLRWDAIDLHAGMVSVIRVAEEVSGHVRLKPYPKSKAGRLTVPLPPFALDLL